MESDKPTTSRAMTDARSAVRLGAALRQIQEQQAQIAAIAARANFYTQGSLAQLLTTALAWCDGCEADGRTTSEEATVAG